MNLENFKKAWPNFSKKGRLELSQQIPCNKEYLSTIAHGHRVPSKIFERSLLREFETMMNRVTTNGMFKND